MGIFEILVLVWLHFVGDFILQSDRHAQGKSSKNLVLAEHVTLYMLAMSAATFFMPVTWAWVAVNWIAHFITDYVSSRLTSYLWKRGQRHWFFVVIGADQSLHFTALFLTYIWLV